MVRDELPRDPGRESEGNPGITSMNEFMLADQVILTAHRIGITGRIPEGEMLQALNVQEYIDGITRDLMVKVQRKVYQKRLTPKFTSGTGQIEIEMPLTWWDHFKQTYQDRWWLSWFARRYPAATKVHRFAHRVDVSLEQYWKFPYVWPVTNSPKLMAFEDFDLTTNVFRVQPTEDDNADN